MRILFTILAIIVAATPRIGVAAVPHGPFSKTLTSAEVFGLRLGMTPDEAISGAALHNIHVEPSQISYGPCEDQREAMIRAGRLTAGQVGMRGSASPERKCVETIEAAASANSIQLVFAEDWPAHPGKMVLLSVNAQIMTRTLADKQRLYEATVQKFGLPTLFGKNGYVDMAKETVPSGPSDASPNPLSLWLTESCWKKSIADCDQRPPAMVWAGQDLTSYTSAPGLYASLAFPLPTSAQLDVCNVVEFKRLFAIRLAHENTLTSNSVRY